MIELTDIWNILKEDIYMGETLYTAGEIAKALKPKGSFFCSCFGKAY